jgi:hypothetical protein
VIENEAAVPTDARRLARGPFAVDEHRHGFDHDAVE